MSDDLTWAEPGELKPWGKNPRKNDASVDGVVESIRRFGFGAPIVARAEDGRIIAGHTRWKAAKRMGLESVPVRYMRGLSDEEAAALALADNRLTEATPWDDEALTEVLRDLGELASGLGWSDEELTERLDSGSEMEPADDEPPDVEEEGEPDSAVGQVYELGPHRLVCGDSTDPEVWAALMGEDRAQCVWTDPPYGVAIVGGSHALTPDERRARGGKEIENDDLSEEDLLALLRASLGEAARHSAPGAAWYVAAPAGPLNYLFATVLREMSVWRWTLQWVKDRFVLGRADYHHRHEPIFYGWVPGAAHYFVPDRTQDTVLEFARPGASKDHPTMKPVALVARCIENSSKPGWIVADPFGGSGTTLMASAQLGRRARLIELDPRYCDVIRRRWTRYAKQNGIDAGTGALEEPDAA